MEISIKLLGLCKGGNHVHLQAIIDGITYCHAFEKSEVYRDISDKEGNLREAILFLTRMSVASLDKSLSDVTSKTAVETAYKV